MYIIERAIYQYEYELGVPHASISLPSTFVYSTEPTTEILALFVARSISSVAFIFL